MCFLINELVGFCLGEALLPKCRKIQSFSSSGTFGMQNLSQAKEVFFFCLFFVLQEPREEIIGRVCLRRLHECFASTLLKEPPILINRF